MVKIHGLFKFLTKIAFPAKLQSLIEFFYNVLRGTVHYDGNVFEYFKIHNTVKEGCAIAPSLYGTAEENLARDLKRDKKKKYVSNTQIQILKLVESRGQYY